MTIRETKNIGAVKPLFRQYMEHMTQFFPIKPKDKASWINNALTYLDLYHSEADRRIYISSNNNVIIGFAFINSYFRFNASGKAVAEFYISEDYQTRGLGRELAEYTFSMQPGLWEVCVAAKNTPGYDFWDKTISAYTDSDYTIMQTQTYDGCGFAFQNS